jgi:hypothetical protein
VGITALPGHRPLGFRSNRVTCERYLSSVGNIWKANDLSAKSDTRRQYAPSPAIMIMIRDPIAGGSGLICHYENVMSSANDGKGVI